MNPIISSWSEYFLRHVYLAALKSKDSKTKIGAVIVRDNIVVSEGYNGMCRGVNDYRPERYERPVKYNYFEHGERNSIYNAARHGITTLGCDLYTQGIPCADCARGVIQAGIKQIFVHKQWREQENFETRPKWKESIDYSLEMLNEAGVHICEIDQLLGLNAFLDGKIISV